MNILIPDSWLREYLDTKATPSQLKEYLSLCGPSVERVNSVKDDTIYEIEITSNRIDMVGVIGIAREAAAILPRFGISAKLKPNFNNVMLNSFQYPKEIPNQVRDDKTKELLLTISDINRLCYRIIAVVMDNVKIGRCPDYIRDRLEKSGVRSLNNFIDITNYVMLELGHPCHVFDYDLIKTGKLIIRRAKDGESLITLDDKKIELFPEDVIIDDGTGRIIDLPGIIGTKNSVVTNATKRIIFFIESNKPIVIRKTSMRTGIRSLAATINEKHPDTDLAKTTLLRAIKLAQQIGAKQASKIIDVYPNPLKPRQISISPEFINERLGIVLKTEEIINILKSLSFRVGPLTGSDLVQLTITPPSFRQIDVTIPEDIVEEVARIYGYHKFPTKIMAGEIPITAKPKDLVIEEKIKTTLKYWGFTECYHYSFTSSKLLDKSGLDKKAHLEIANPLTEDTQYMRISLIPSILETIEKNQSYKNNLKLFELAKVYIPQRNNLPKEDSHLVIAGQQDFSHLKGIVGGIMREIGIHGVSGVVTSESPYNFFHPKQTLNFSKEGKTLAVFGKLHPKFRQSFSISKNVFIAQLYLEHLIYYSTPIKKYTPIPDYPPIIEDLTIIISAKTYLGEVLEEIYKVSNLIKIVDVVDKFKNAINLRISYQSSEKNLTTEDAQKLQKSILRALQTKFNISLKKIGN